MRTLLGFGCGLLFGIGLVAAGMANPAKLLNFLDLFGSWDPSLGFLMGSAVAVTFLGYRLVWTRKAPVMMDRFDLPAARLPDRRLVAGAALFGLGWGLGGYCPGPALVAMTLAAPGTLVFVPAMLTGIWIGFRARQASFSGAGRLAAHCTVS